ncbi:ribulose-phosphate 3-epimerase, partial [Salmonella enterica subsp. enterica serovar Infantis]
AKAQAAGAELVHFDDMDNNNEPNLTNGPRVLKSLHQNANTAPNDVHQMVKPVYSILPD